MVTLSRSARITLLLVIDVLFFFVELIIGYVVGSLALVADSFHMLNDVLSLAIALYAIKLTGRTSDHRYTYGWHRAEILAALVNGVFLLALCFSIVLEAIERLVKPPTVSNAELVVIVGCLGLASNVVGLFLFHEHGHSHGSDRAQAAPLQVGASTASSERHRAVQAQDPTRLEMTPMGRTSHEAGASTPSLVSGHPAFTRAAIVQAANDIASQAQPSSSTRALNLAGPSTLRPPPPDDVESTAGTLTHDYEGHEKKDARTSIPSVVLEEMATDNPSEAVRSNAAVHAPAHGGHEHGHGHSHGNMNMRALLLHVLGDALGNIGVIITGLAMWLTEWHYKYYLDPVVSLVITVIIFCSALPLVRSTSYILLQGVPTTISLEDVRAAILDVPGVLSVHELHVWQLSEAKVVASVHIAASRQVDFMVVAGQVREKLHHLGIHSCTIQPEYHQSQNSPLDEALMTTAPPCLILCPPDQACSAENNCCPPAYHPGEP